MKIRFLIGNAYGAGGTIRTTLNMANSLAQRHDVEVVSIVRRHEASAFPIDPGVRVRVLVDTSPAGRERRKALPPPVRSLELRLLRASSRLAHKQDVRYDVLFNGLTDVRLLRFLATTRGGVLVSTRPALNLVVARYGRRSVVRVGQEHTSLQRHRPELRAAIEQYYPRLDAVATLTPAEEDRYRALLHGRTRVVTIPNAAPDMGGVRSTLDAPVIIAAGRLTKLKAFDRLLAAFKPVAEKHPEWQLRIFGRGELHAALEVQRDELGLRDRVLLPGYTNSLPQEMGKASIYALSSRSEGFPMVLLEAMACGLPVVAFDCSAGVRAIVDDDRNGLLVPNGDMEGLTRALLELVENPERRRRLGGAAVEKASRYETPAIAARWENLFTELAANRGTRL